MRFLLPPTGDSDSTNPGASRILVCLCIEFLYDGFRTAIELLEPPAVGKSLKSAPTAHRGDNPWPCGEFLLCNAHMDCSRLGSPPKFPHPSAGARSECGTQGDNAERGGSETLQFDAFSIQHSCRISVDTYPRHNAPNTLNLAYHLGHTPAGVQRSVLKWVCGES